jgi:hypothetical protein
MLVFGLADKKLGERLVALWVFWRRIPSGRASFVLQHKTHASTGGRGASD